VPSARLKDKKSKRKAFASLDIEYKKRLKPMSTSFLGKNKNFTITLAESKCESFTDKNNDSIGYLRIDFVIN